MENLTYYARFGYYGEDGILVTFPDIYCAYTEGDTKEHAIEMAREVLLGSIKTLRMCNDPVNPPRTLDELKKAFGNDLEEFERSFEFVPITVKA